MAAPVDDAVIGAAAHATWPDVALWVLDHDGFAWALAAAVILVVAWKADSIIPALSDAADRWHRRRVERRRELSEPAMAQERLNADMRAVERRLQPPHRDAPEHEGQGG